MRLGGLAASLFKSKVTLVRDDGDAKSPSKPVDARRSASAATTPTPEPGALPQPSQFWAHVYGMEGERVGSAFMTRQHMEHLQTGAQALAPPPPKPQPPKKARQPAKRDKERDKAKGPRVFVGRPLASWKVRTVRDLEPSTDIETTTRGKEAGKGKGKERERESPRRRCYIGNPAPLYEPYGRMPGSARMTPLSSRCSTPVFDSDGSLTPLSELEVEAEDWPQPEVGECCSWAPPLPPGTIAHGRFSPLVEVTGSPGVVGSGLGVEMNMDVGDERRSASTVLSEEDMARAISAAFAALSVELPF